MRPDPLTRRTLLAGATISVASGALVACAAGQGTNEATSSAPPVTILYGTSLSERMQGNYKELLVQPFEAAFPRVRVDVDPAALATSDKFKAAMVAGTPFDVVWESDISTYLQGFTIDMAAYAKKDKFNLGLYPKALFDSILSIKGAVAGIPNQTGGNLMVFAYNQPLLQDAGLPEPPTEWGDRTWTWDRFAEYCRKIGKTEGGQLVRAGTQPASIGGLVGNLPYLWGGQWVSNDRTKAVCDSAEMLRAHQAYFALATDKVATLQSGQGQALWGTNDGPKLMAQGRIAFLLSLSSATLGSLLDAVRAGADIRFAPVPRDKNAASFQWLDSNGVVKGARHPDEAWKYVVWQGTTFNWAKSRGTPPPRKELMDQWVKEFYPDIPVKARLSVVLKILDYPGPYDPGWVLPKFGFRGTDVVQAWVNDVYAGKANIADGLRTLKPQLQTMLDAEDNKYKG